MNYSRDWTELEKSGYKPKASLFDDGFPGVPTQDSPWPSFFGMVFFVGVVIIGAVLLQKVYGIA